MATTICYMHSKASNIFMIMFIFSTLISISHAQLSANFYATTCPDFPQIVTESVQEIVGNNPRWAASFLRLHFHDCFVTGCDASVLLDTPGGEKESLNNVNSLRGFELIDGIKGFIEPGCPGVVSCADILALVARESVIAVGGPSWPVLLGRRDSTTSASAAFTNGQLPLANFNVGNLVNLFRSKGFTTRDMVALSGGHTIGLARCLRFRNRIYGGQNIAAAFAQSMQQVCPRTGGVGDDNLGPLDFATPTAFNNDYFEGLTRRQGLLTSDQTLFSGGSQTTRNIVQEYANNEQRFFNDFSAAMFKMSLLGVKTGNNGIVRTNCRVAN